MGVYGAFLKNGFLTQMAHRGQYAMRMLAKIMGWSTGMIMVLILLERFGQIGGWNREEILLLYAFDILSYSVAATFFMGSFGKLHRLIRQGELDLVLTKPADPMIYLAASHVSAGYTSNYLMGGAVLVVCLIRLDIALTPVHLFWLAADLLGASLIQAAGFVFTAVPAFWIGESEGLYRLLYKNLTEFIQYPLSVYHRGIRELLTFVLPYAFINYYPVQYFIDRQEGICPGILRYLTPRVGCGVFPGCSGGWVCGPTAGQAHNQNRKRGKQNGIY